MSVQDKLRELRRFQAESSDSDDSDVEVELSARERAQRGRDEARRKRRAAARAAKEAEKREAALPHPNDRPRKIQYRNKQRTLLLSTRGLSGRHRHLLKDLNDLMPHAKLDSKYDDKKGGLQGVNAAAELRNCNNVMLLESRKDDVFMWISRVPTGPSVRFLVKNVHTMSELRLSGNCIKGSRPILVFDDGFARDRPRGRSDLGCDGVADDDAGKEPQWSVMQEMLTQCMGTPLGHPKSRPFVDHVMHFARVDEHIWFRNYQLVYDTDNTASAEQKDPVLVEIGPRLVLEPIKIFDGSFGGSVLWENPAFVSPNELRRAERAALKAQDLQRQTKAKKAPVVARGDDDFSDVFDNAVMRDD
ncbi:MAG: hypothetical protein MHM6MM_001194 [Cercozoa sp. M6MM]